MIDIKNVPFEIVDSISYIWKTPRNIYVYKDGVTCHKCKSKLFESFTLIPVGNNKKAKIPGMECKKCDTLYVKNPDPVVRVLTDNPNAKGFSFNGFSNLWDSTARKEQNEQKQKEEKEIQNKKSLLESVESGVLFVTIKNGEETRHYIITKSRQNAKTKIGRDDLTAVIFHYSDFLALELLTGIYREERKKRVLINSKEYTVDKVVESDNFKAFEKRIIPSSVSIKNKRDFENSVNIGIFEIIHLLMYSRTSYKYEIVHAAYNMISEKCYIDNRTFRRFIKEHGNPGIKYVTDTINGHYKRSFEEMNTESVLFEYGYSVSQKSGLTDEQRHELLAEIVDLNILSAYQIASYLDFFIGTHSDEKNYIAQIKWKSDRKFILNYKVNPDRFFIMK